MQQIKRVLSRRDALKTLAALTGAAAISGVPAKWATPLVQVGALPAHAQCTPTETTAAMTIVNMTDGTLTLVLLRGASEPFMQAVVGPMSVDCLPDIPPDWYTVCATVEGGSCPDSQLSCFGEYEILAGFRMVTTISCRTVVGGLDIVIENE